MTDRQETIADIIAEMKREAAKIFPALPIAVLQLATRIEAAWKREREVTKPAENVNSASASDSGGNSAKLREAAKDAYDKLLLWNYTDRDTARMALGVMNKLDAALDAPMRNCDRFATLPDALAAWRDADPRKAGPFDLWIFDTAKEGGAE